MRARAAVFLIVTLSASAAPRLPDRNPARGMVGSWRVVFENGVRQTCQINDTIFVTEPLRSSKGKAELADKAVIFKFEDDRLERWKLDNGRMVVEHWFPSSAYPNGPRVVGVAEKAK